MQVFSSFFFKKNNIFSANDQFTTRAIKDILSFDFSERKKPFAFPYVFFSGFPSRNAPLVLVCVINIGSVEVVWNLGYLNAGELSPPAVWFLLLHPPKFNAFFPLTSPVPFRDCTLFVSRYCVWAFGNSVLHLWYCFFLSIQICLGSLIENGRTILAYLQRALQQRFPIVDPSILGLYCSTGCKVLDSSSPNCRFSL